MGILTRTLYWLVPPAACLAIYWPGLWAWFVQDDFAWLGLYQRYQEGESLLTLLFAPMAQGSIRPLSERLFFLSFFKFFWLNALPYRLAVFATQFANIALLSSVATRLTRSLSIGFLAAVFWVANSALAWPMSWSSSYNQVLASFFMLAAFSLLLRHIDTGRPVFWVLQWCAFLLGFGALEINVVYPVLALSYTFFCARKYFRKCLWLIPVSVAFVGLHMWVSPGATTGPYVRHLDLSIFQTFGQYAAWLFGGMPILNLPVNGIWHLIAKATAIASGVALTGFVVWKVRRRERLAAVLLIWFLALLAPYLPLKDHISVYYLVLPALAVSILGAWAFVAAWKSGGERRIAALVLALCYIGTSAYGAYATTEWQRHRSRRAWGLVLGTAHLHHQHKGKSMLLKGVDDELFWAAVREEPFRLLGIEHVYLTPGSANKITEHPELDPLSKFILPPEAARRAIDEGLVAVYDVGGIELLDITDSYQASSTPADQTGLRSEVFVGGLTSLAQLGEGWHRLEQGFRWSSQQADVTLPPAAEGAKLLVSGYCPAASLKDGPVQLTVSVDGSAFPAVEVTEPDSGFRFEFPLKPSPPEAGSMTVTVTLDRTMDDPTGDDRKLGLVFGTFEVTAAR